MIIIENMDVPESCEKCRFRMNKSQNSWRCSISSTFYGNKARYLNFDLIHSGKVKPDWCPIQDSQTFKDKFISRDEIMAQIKEEENFIEDISTDDDKYKTSLNKSTHDLIMSEWAHFEQIILEAEGPELTIAQSVPETALPEVQDKGVVKEYDNGMISMRKETFNEYEQAYILQQIRASNFKSEE